MLDLVSTACLKYGNPDVFTPGEIAVPELKEDEVVVKVFGSSVNPVIEKICPLYSLAKAHSHPERQILPF